jgi:hypothetical protein
MYDFERDPNFKETLQGYRYSQSGRDVNPKTGLETLPIDFLPNLDKKYKTPKVMYGIADQMRRNIEAVRMAYDMGYEMPGEVLDPKFLAAMALKENRPDLGSNSWANDPRARELYYQLSRRFGRDPGGFAADVYAHNLRAEEANKGRGISFARAWNGNATVRDAQGRVIASGKRYEQYMPKFVAAVEHPINKPYLDFFNRYMNTEKYTTPLPEADRKYLEREYAKRQQMAQDAALKNWNFMRRLQYNLLGTGGMFGIDPLKVPSLARKAVPAPNYEQLQQWANPIPHYYGGGIASLKKG